MRVWHKESRPLSLGSILELGQDRHFGYQISHVQKEGSCFMSMSHLGALFIVASFTDTEWGPYLLLFLLGVTKQLYMYVICDLKFWTLLLWFCECISGSKPVLDFMGELLMEKRPLNWQTHKSMQKSIKIPMEKQECLCVYDDTFLQVMFLAFLTRKPDDGGKVWNLAERAQGRSDFFTFVSWCSFLQMDGQVTGYSPERWTQCFSSEQMACDFPHYSWTWRHWRFSLSNANSSQASEHL